MTQDERVEAAAAQFHGNTFFQIFQKNQRRFLFHTEIDDGLSMLLYELAYVRYVRTTRSGKKTADRHCKLKNRLFLAKFSPISVL